MRRFDAIHSVACFGAAIFSMIAAAIALSHRANLIAGGDVLLVVADAAMAWASFKAARGSR